MKRPTILLVLVLAGCVDSHQTIQTELPRYFGRPIEDLVAKLGPPTSEQVIMGRQSYNWFTRYASTCNIRVFVAKGVVQTVESEGGEIGCRVFAEQLTK